MGVRIAEGASGDVFRGCPDPSSWWGAAVPARARVAARLASRQLRRERRRASLVTIVVALATAVFAFVRVTTARASTTGATLSLANAEGADGAIVLDPASLTILSVAGSLALALSALLIAPAFLISLERRLHDLGLLAAIGARSSDLAATVAIEGLVLGAAGATCGAALAVAVSQVTVPLGPRAEWLAMTEAAGLAAATGTVLTLAASTYPALRALGARPGHVRVEPSVPSKRWVSSVVTALASLACLAGGWILAVRGAASDGSALLPIGVIAAQAGAVGCVHVLLLAGSRLPSRNFVLAYVLRDAARHRARVVPAVASAMTAITVATAVLVYQNSMHAAEARQRSAVDGVVSFAASDSIVLSALAALIVYTALTVSAALAAQETQAEATILGVLGAPSRTQRQIASGQATVVAGLGSALGVFGGVGLAALLLRVQEHQSLQGVSPGQIALQVPVAPLLLLVTLVPCLVVLLASRRASRHEPARDLFEPGSHN